MSRYAVSAACSACCGSKTARQLGQHQAHGTAWGDPSIGNATHASEILMLQGLSLPASSNSSRKTTTEALLARLLLFPFMSDQESSDDQLALQLMSPPDPAGRGLGRGPSTGTYPLKTVVRQQQDNAKTCRLLALEVGSLKAELTREQKKRAQAVRRATAAEAAHRHAEQRLNELLYSNSKLQQELTAAKEAAESSSRRVHSLRQSLADAEAEAQEKRVLGQQQVQQLALLASTLQALVTACCCNTACTSSTTSKGAHLAAQLTHCLLDELIQLDSQLSGSPAAAAAVTAGERRGRSGADAHTLIQQCKQFVTRQQQQQPAGHTALQTDADRPHRLPQDGRAQLLTQLEVTQQLQQTQDKHAFVTQQLSTARTGPTDPHAALASQRSPRSGGASPDRQQRTQQTEKQQQWQQQKLQLELAAAHVEVAELRAALSQQKAAQQQQQQNPEAAVQSTERRLEALARKLASGSPRHQQQAREGAAAGGAAAESPTTTAARAAVTAMRFGLAGVRGSGSPLRPRPSPAAAAETVPARESPVRSSVGADWAPAAAAAAAVDSGVGAGDISSSTARRALAFQSSAAAGDGCTADAYAVYSIHASGPGRSSPVRDSFLQTGAQQPSWLVSQDGPGFEAGGACSSPRFKGAAALVGSAGTDRYAALVREADAALQQLAACRKAANAAAPPPAAAAGGAAGRDCSPGGGNHSSSFSRPAVGGQNSSPGRCTMRAPASAAASALHPYQHTAAPGSLSAGLLKTYSAGVGVTSPLRAAGAAAAAGYAAGAGGTLGLISSSRSPAAAAGCSSGSCSRHLVTSSAAAAAAGQAGKFCGHDSCGGRGGTFGSPSRLRPGSAAAAAAAAALGTATGAAGHVSAVLRGELRALDSDIAAAEASLQAAAQRLGAAGTLQPQTRW